MRVCVWNVMSQIWTERCTTEKSTYRISIENSSACCLTDEWNCFENWCVQEQLLFTTVTHKNTVQFKFAMSNDLESSWKIAKSWKSEPHILPQSSKKCTWFHFMVAISNKYHQLTNNVVCSFFFLIILNKKLLKFHFEYK